MLQEMVLAKVEGATQAALVSGLTGQSFTVSQVAASGNGMGTCLILSPDGGATAGQGLVALKLEGTRQMAQMSGLVGKSVTIGKAPMVAGGAGKWIAFYPKTALAAKGLATAAAAGLGTGSLSASQLVMLKLEGAGSIAQSSGLAGKSFTVIKSAAVAGEPGKWLFLQPAGNAAAAAKDIVVLKVQNAAGQLSWLTGKTFTVAQAPVVAADNAAKYLFLQPTAGLAAKGAAGTMIAAKGASAAGLTPAMKTVALNSAGTGTAGSAAALTAGKAATASGTIWSGTGLSLGLGLGLGAVGPVVLGALIAAAGYGVYRYRKTLTATDADLDEDLSEALS
ncbi:Magnetosome protein MamD [Azospirillaceae bacterium]|nr:magnetosome protein MamD [uncultured bacterium]